MERVTKSWAQVAAGAGAGRPWQRSAWQVPLWWMVGLVLNRACSWQASLEGRRSHALARPPLIQAPCQSPATLAAV